jgi:hypothetical protein
MPIMIRRPRGIPIGIVCGLLGGRDFLPTDLALPRCGGVFCFLRVSPAGGGLTSVAAGLASRYRTELVSAGASKSRVQRKAPQQAGRRVDSLNQQRPQ